MSIPTITIEWNMLWDGCDQIVDKFVISAKTVSIVGYGSDCWDQGIYYLPLSIQTSLQTWAPQYLEATDQPYDEESVENFIRSILQQLISDNL